MQSLEELRRLTRGALAEMRTLLLELRPASVVKTPLHELLAQLTEAITGRIELTFGLFVEQIPPLPEEVHTAFYRIAQEALNNVVKHAQATRVSVRLSAARPATIAAEDVEPVVVLVIEDDGVGFSNWKEGLIHLGISIMNERAAAIRADLSVESQPGYGTRVTLNWPGLIENSS
jgi:signal transduction histidine kinase